MTPIRIEAIERISDQIDAPDTRQGLTLWMVIVIEVDFEVGIGLR